MDASTARSAASSSRSHESPFELSETFAWVTLDTDFEHFSVAHAAVRSIGGAVRRDHDDDLAARFGAWMDDLGALARRGEFLFSVNDYALLSRNRPG